MTDITITDADWELRSAIWRKLKEGLEAGYPFNTADRIDHEVEQLLAAHRLSAIEQSAQIAEKHGTHWVAKDIRKMREG